MTTRKCAIALILLTSIIAPPTGALQTFAKSTPIDRSSAATFGQGYTNGSRPAGVALGGRGPAVA